MAIVCEGCKFRVEPVRHFEKSPRADKWWRITSCPRERCGFNIDIDACDKPGGEDSAHSKDRRRHFWKGDHWD